MRPISRRELFITGAGAIGGAALLAACGGGSKQQFSVIRRIPAEGLLVPGEVRLPVGIAIDGTVQDDGPDRLTATLTDVNRSRTAQVEAVKRNTGLSTAYWAFRMPLGETGLYELTVDGSDGSAVSFGVADPSLVTIPKIGDDLPPFDTPTTDDPRGVDPICSRSGGPCPFHDVTLTDALASGKPVIYLIGTPGHCQTGVCAPGLEELIATSTRIGDRAVIVHADVYTDDTATITTPAVEALQLSFEPVLFFTDASGTLVDRLDAIWDQTELDETVSRLGLSA